MWFIRNLISMKNWEISFWFCITPFSCEHSSSSVAGVNPSGSFTSSLQVTSTFISHLDCKGSQRPAHPINLVSTPTWKLERPDVSLRWAIGNRRLWGQYPVFFQSGPEKGQYSPVPGSTVMSVWTAQTAFHGYWEGAGTLDYVVWRWGFEVHLKGVEIGMFIMHWASVWNSQWI